MKKIVLVALVAATSAFGMTNGKSMVELNGCLDNGRCDTLDLRFANDDEEDAELDASTISLNYNYLFTNHFGAGLQYSQESETIDGDFETGDKSQTIGVNFFWNFDGGWESSYVGVRYLMATAEEGDEAAADGDLTANTWVLEYGKRMQMGKVFGLALLYSPSVTYSMSTTEWDAQEDDITTNELRLNVANFAVTF